MKQTILNTLKNYTDSELKNMYRSSGDNVRVLVKQEQKRRLKGLPQ